ncbi:hypothetical protein ACVW00_000561 [Marmoricola sp. URHA0025 HA25]
MNGPMKSSPRFPDGELTRHLEQKADQFDRLGGARLDLSQVLDRAGEIKRGRRMRASLVMAAVVLAVAVPTGLVALDRDRTTDPVTPAHPVQSDDGALTLGDLKTGAPPAHGYAQDGTWQLPVAANGLSGLHGQVIRAAALEGGAMVAMGTGDGDQTAYFIYAEGGTLEQSWPVAGGFAVSPEGNVAAFVEPDGTVMAVQDGGSRYFEVAHLAGAASPHGGAGRFSVAAVTGENCSGRSEEVGCTIYVDTTDATHEIWAVAPHQEPVLVKPQLIKLTGLTAAGAAIGQLSSSNDGSCWAALDQGDDQQWKTCTYALKAFSPDGQLVLAGSAQADGAGDTRLAVLDADSGKPVLDLTTAEGASVYDVQWEDASHVVATVSEGNRWAVLRVGMDGRREYAMSPVDGTDPYVSPFVLPTP